MWGGGDGYRGNNEEHMGIHITLDRERVNSSGREKKWKKWTYKNWRLGIYCSIASIALGPIYVLGPTSHKLKISRLNNVSLQCWYSQ